MVVAALLARNEADRYLAPVLQALQPLVDHILVLDDNSTDATVEVARRHGAEVRLRRGQQMWGNESPARAELWAWGQEVAGTGWLLIADADQELVAPKQAFDAMCSSWVANAWGIRLFDCWDDPSLHRVDGYWATSHIARPWLFRPAACPAPVWPMRGIHTGHAPQNFPYAVGIAPETVYWKHYGWLRAEDRATKFAAYTEQSAHLTPYELAHLNSVTDGDSSRPYPGCQA